MPHRPIGSRWRCNTADFVSTQRGQVVRVTGHTQRNIRNIVFNETRGVQLGETAAYDLDTDRWELLDAVEAPGPNPAPAAAPVAPPVPPPTRFTPLEGEQYMVVYRQTRARSVRIYGEAGAIRDGQNRFWLANHGGTTSVHNDLEAARASLRAALNANVDYDGYIIPLRAVEHWHAGVRQPLGVIIQPAAVPVPDDEDDDDNDGI